MNIQKLVIFLYIINEHMKAEFKNTIYKFFLKSHI